MPRKKPRYTGVLRRRLANPRVTPIDEFVAALSERMQALADHYGLDWRAPDFWSGVGMALAHDHVEGFQVSAGKGGRPVDPGQVTLDIFLLVEVSKAHEECRPRASAYRNEAKRRRAQGIKTNEGALRKRFNNLMKDTPEALRAWRMVCKLIEADDEKKVEESS